jgi:hypothetical protein
MSFHFVVAVIFIVAVLRGFWRTPCWGGKSWSLVLPSSLVTSADVCSFPSLSPTSFSSSAKLSLSTRLSATLTPCHHLIPCQPSCRNFCNTKLAQMCTCLFALAKNSTRPSLLTISESPCLPLLAAQAALCAVDVRVPQTLRTALQKVATCIPHTCSRFFTRKTHGLDHWLLTLPVRRWWSPMRF